MSRDLSKIVALFLAFMLGLGCYALAFYVAMNTITINQLRANNVEINTDKYIGDNPEVSLEDMTVMGALNEYKEISKLGDEATINLLVDRYALILPSTLDKILSDEVREVPLRILLSSEGIDILASTLYLGDIENYECRTPGGEKGDPKDPENHWYNPATDSIITGIDDIIADFSLYDILHGEISSEALLEDVTVGELLGYTLGEDGKYYDYDEKVTGILAVFADCTVYEITDKANETQVGNLIGYEYDEVNSCWVDENGDPVHTFMNTISNRNINSLSTLMDELTIGDVIPEKERTGVIAVIPATTSLKNINKAVNDAVMYTPLQFFINEGLVTFENMAALDYASYGHDDRIVTFYPKEQGDEGYEEFLKACSYYGAVEGEGGREAAWTVVTDSFGNVKKYTIPKWRTMPLNQSFDYIVSLMTNS